jgi:hypothetical protein
MPASVADWLGNAAQAGFIDVSRRWRFRINRLAGAADLGSSGRVVADPQLYLSGILDLSECVENRFLFEVVYRHVERTSCPFDKIDQMRCRLTIDSGALGLKIKGNGTLLEGRYVLRHLCLLSN